MTPNPAVTSWLLVYISRWGLAGWSEVLAPIYRYEQQGLKFKLELEPRWAESDIHAFCLSYSSSLASWSLSHVSSTVWPETSNTGSPVSVSGLASRAMGVGQPLSHSTSVLRRGGVDCGHWVPSGLQAGGRRSISGQALQAAGTEPLYPEVQLSPQHLCGTLSIPAPCFFVSFPSPGFCGNWLSKSLISAVVVTEQGGGVSSR